jgi:hypothetical protein
MTFKHTGNTFLVLFKTRECRNEQNLDIQTHPPNTFLALGRIGEGIILAGLASAGESIRDRIL